MRKPSTGFSLIELMIAMAIVAILAAIGYPSYQEQVRKSHRAEAKSKLLEVGQLMERRFTTDNAYNIDSSDTAQTGDATNTLLVEVVGGTTQRNLPSGVDNTDRRYHLLLTDLGPTTYTLTAQRDNSQAGDRCGDFRITHTGVKTCLNTPSSLSDQECRAQCW